VCVTLRADILVAILNTGRAHRTAADFYNVRVFVTGQALSNIGTFSQVVALSLLVLSLTNSGFALGVVMSLQALPMVLLGPWAGAQLDRLPLRRVLFATAIAGAAQASCLAFLALTGSIALPWVFVLAFGLGCIQVFDRPAGQAFMTELVPREFIPSGVSLASTAQSIGRLAGPALAAVVYTWGGSGTVFAVNAASYAAVIVALLLLRVHELLPRGAGHAHGRDVRSGVVFAWRSRDLRAILIGNACIGLLAFNFPTFLASIASLTFGQPYLFGVAESLNAVTALVAGIALSRYLRHPTLQGVALAAVALGGTLAWVAVSPTAAVFLASMPFFGFAVVSYVTSSQSFVQQRAPSGMGGRMMSLYMLGSMGTTPIGALLVGVVIDRVSPRGAVGLGAAAAILTGLVLLVLARRDDGHS
jgi:MFS family permease